MEPAVENRVHPLRCEKLQPTGLEDKPAVAGLVFLVYPIAEINVGFPDTAHGLAANPAIVGAFLLGLLLKPIKSCTKICEGLKNHGDLLCIMTEKPPHNQPPKTGVAQLRERGRLCMEPRWAQVKKAKPCALYERRR